MKLWTDDGRRTDAGAWTSYKLTLFAFGSGELIKTIIRIRSNNGKERFNQRNFENNFKRFRIELGRYIDVEQPIDPGAPCRGFL